MEPETKPEEEPQEPVEEIDPAVKRLMEAEKALNQPDAIMESGVFRFLLCLTFAFPNNIF